MTFIGAYSDKGTVKQVDQDACCFLEAQAVCGPVAMAVMCDGVGGLSQGELASTTLVCRFATWFQRDLPALVDNASGDCAQLESLVVASWDALLKSSNDSIRTFGNKTDAFLGTTFTGIVCFQNRFVVGHVGDCRLYEVTDTALRQITQDQTLVAQQVAEGLLTPEEAANHPKRNVIMQSVGTQDELEPVFIQGPIDPGALYVLCCDGLYSKLDVAEVQAAFRPGQFASEEQLQQRCNEVASVVMGRGERDNVSVLAFIVAPAAQSANQVATPASDSLAAQPSLCGYRDDDSPTSVVNVAESPTVVIDTAESPTVAVADASGGGLR